MTDKKPYGGRACDHAGGSILTSDSMVNLVEGVVHCQHMGLIHTTVRIRAGRRIELRVKLPIDDERCFFPGQQVIATIPAEAVRLEAGLFRRSRQRLNRWYGRIVLTRREGEAQLITAKIHGESWSLASTIPIFGSIHPTRTWDPVSIVVDSQAIELVSSHGEAPLEPEALFRSRLVYQ